MANGRPGRPRKCTVPQERGRSARRVQGGGTYSFRNLPVVAAPGTPKTGRASKNDRQSKKTSTRKVAKLRRKTCIINGMTCPVIDPWLLKLRPKNNNYWEGLKEFFQWATARSNVVDQNLEYSREQTPEVEMMDEVIPAETTHKPTDEAKQIEDCTPCNRSPSVIVLGDSDEEMEDLEECQPGSSSQNDLSPASRSPSDKNEVCQELPAVVDNVDQDSFLNGPALPIDIIRGLSPAPSDIADVPQGLPAGELDDIEIPLMDEHDHPDDEGLEAFACFLFAEKGNQSPEARAIEQALELTGSDVTQDSLAVSGTGTPIEEEIVPLTSSSEDAPMPPALSSSDDSHEELQPQTPCCSSSLLPSPTQNMLIEDIIREEIVISKCSSTTLPVQKCSSEVVPASGLLNSVASSPSGLESSQGALQRQEPCCSSSLLPSPAQNMEVEDIVEQEIVISSSSSPAPRVDFAPSQTESSAAPSKPVEQPQMEAPAAPAGLPAPRQNRANIRHLLAALKANEESPEDQEPVQTVGEFLNDNMDGLTKSAKLIALRESLSSAPSTSDLPPPLSTYRKRCTPPVLPSSSVPLQRSCSVHRKSRSKPVRAASTAQDTVPATPAPSPVKEESLSSIDISIASVLARISNSSTGQDGTFVGSLPASPSPPMMQARSDGGLEMSEIGNLDAKSSPISCAQDNSEPGSLPAPPATSLSVEITPLCLPIPAPSTPPTPEPTLDTLSTSPAQDILEDERLPDLVPPATFPPAISTPEILPIPISPASSAPSPPSSTQSAPRDPSPTPRRSGRITGKSPFYRDNRRWQKSGTAAPPPLAPIASMPPTPPSTGLPSYPPGREEWRRELNSLKIGSREFVVKFKEGEHLFLQDPTIPVHVWENGVNYREKIGNFEDIHLFESKEGLDLEFPELSFDNIDDYLNKEDVVSVINSTEQESYWMKMGDFMSAFKAENRGPDPLNLLSKELSRDQKTLNDLVKVPEFVNEKSIIRKLELVIQKKIELLKEKGTHEDIPRLENQLENLPRYQKFLLISMKNSYTDVHNDFAGSAVYYHVKEGEKVFHVARRTPENMEAYKRSELDKDPNKPWMVETLWDQWQRVVIKAGQTAFIPSGILHAVLTTKDSIVFGGNFLTEQFLARQFDSQEMEEKCLKKGIIGESLMFQGFRDVMWMYAEHLLIPELEYAITTNVPLDDVVARGELFKKNMEANCNVGGKLYNKSQKKQLWDEISGLLPSSQPSTSSPTRTATKRACQEDGLATSAPPKKRGRGRPRKLQPSSISSAAKRSLQEDVGSMGVPVKRGRGRPRKNE